MPRALWITAPGQVQLRETVLPAPGPDDIALRLLASGISRGTERLVLQGRVPPSQHAAMRAPLQEGEFGFPVKYGYCAVGAADDGTRYFALAPHQERFIAPRHFCAPLPDALPTRRAVLGANMETALNVMWDARPALGERALVIGAGVVGLLCAYLLAHIPGMAVTVTDIDPARAGIARALGARFTTEAPPEQDLIIHASASEAGLRMALERAAFEARIIEASWFGATRPALPLGEAFHQKRLTIASTQVGSISPTMRGRRSHAARMALALELLCDTRLDALLGPFIAFDDLPARYAALLDEPALCPVIVTKDPA